MALPARHSDPEIESCAAQIAAEILAHPLASRFGWDTIWALMAIAGGDPSIHPTDARPILRMALASIDLAEIQASMEVVP